jgi:hypothetical protein
MGKYDSLKYWAKVKARVPHRCQRCGAMIDKGEFYYKEKIDFVRPPPGLFLGICANGATKKPRVKDERLASVVSSK